MVTAISVDLTHYYGASGLCGAPIWPASPNSTRCGDSALVISAALRYLSSMDKESIDQLARRLANAVPQGLKSVGEDLEQNFRSLLTSGISKLDLVTREEFEVQQAVLAKTRQTLETLEGRLKALEEEPKPKVAMKAAKKTAGKKKTASKKKKTKT
jgi:BMFP domain-containing protein YqiC